MTLTNKARFVRPVLETLDERSLPAVYSYTAATQTLTVKASEGDSIVISQIANKPMGYLTATDASNSFDSTLKSSIVRNLVVNFGSTNVGSVQLITGLSIAGNLTVFSGKNTTTVNSNAHFGGNVAYKAGNNHSQHLVNFDSSTQIGKNFSFETSNGTGIVNLFGGYIGGNATFNSNFYAAKSMTVNVCSVADLEIKGNLKFTGGADADSLNSISNHSLKIGGDFYYNGSVKSNKINFASSPIEVAGGLQIHTGSGAEDFHFNSVTTGKELVLSTGNNADSILFDEAVFCGSYMSVDLGAGSNELNLSGVFTNGDLKIVGGSGNDSIWLLSKSDFNIGRNFELNLGDGNNFAFALGSHQVDIGQNFSIIGGKNADQIDFEANSCPIFIANASELKMGGGNNTLNFSDFRTNDGLKITAGSGANSVLFRNATVDGNVDFQMFGANTVKFSDNLDARGWLNYFGGDRTDKLTIAKGSIGAAVTIDLKNDTTDGSQELYLGTQGKLYVDDSVSISAGESNDTIHVYRLFANGTCKINSGAGSDLVTIDDSYLSGDVSIDLGAGNDYFEVEIYDNPGGIPNLDQATTFGGKLTVYGRAGNDHVFLGIPTGDEHYYVGKISLFGGADSDTFEIRTGTNFLGDKFEDFEIGAF